MTRDDLRGRSGPEGAVHHRGLVEAEALFRDGRSAGAVQLLADLESSQLSVADQAQALLLGGLSLSDTGNLVSAIDTLRQATELAAAIEPTLHFATLSALFVREAEFQPPNETDSGIATLRQLASRIGDSQSLASLHLAVARLEGCRGNCVGAHSQLEIARRLATRATNTELSCAVELVEASLESLAGNLRRSRTVGHDCFRRASQSGLARFRIGAAGNLAVHYLHAGESSLARSYLEVAVSPDCEVSFVNVAALDTLAQVELLAGDLASCLSLLERCKTLCEQTTVPCRSWNDLDSDITRCAYHERTENWNAILEIVEAADAELERRTFRAIRTSLLCARARALARLGRQAKAEAALATAIRTCPRGAIDPLIVLEASKAVCLSLRGDTSIGALHFDRALAACDAIGHQYHRTWIARQRDELPQRGRVATTTTGATDHASLLISDVATALGAGHSIELLAHRASGILRRAGLEARLDVQTSTGEPYRPLPSSSSSLSADGQFELIIQGSDRRVALRVKDVSAIDEVALLRGIAEIVQAAVSRTNHAESDDGGPTLWPGTAPETDDDTVFQSPPMIELLKIAARLATTKMPILLTGETGTGKEILARWIHRESRVADGPFVPFNCSAIPRELVESQLFGHRRGAFTGALDSSPGVIRAAEHGTLFLDEIGDLEKGTQPKLLRFLESGEIHPVGEMQARTVQTRILAATNADLETLAAQGGFRSDLYYRIGVATIALPPLRERKDEIPALASLFVKRFAEECGRSGLRVGDEFIAALLLYDWPGNIRQLANEIRRTVAMAADGDTIGVAHLAPAIAELWNDRPVAVAPRAAATVEIALDQPLASAVAEVEERFIQRALEATGGKVSEAAKLLGVSRKGLFLKRRRHGIDGHPADGNGSTQS